MRLVEQTQLLPVKLLEHPGHSPQSVHAGKSGGAGTAFPPMGTAAKAAHIRGLKQLVSFHTTEAKRLGKKLGIEGRSVQSVRAEIGGLMGGGEPRSGFYEFAKWAAHQEMAIGLGTQVAALGAST